MSVVELWWLSLGIAAVVIVVVAALLGLVVAAAKSVDWHAERIWLAGKQIAGNTVSIWILEQADRHLEEMLEAVHAMERSTDAMAGKLGALGGPGPSRDR